MATSDTGGGSDPVMAYTDMPTNGLTVNFTDLSIGSVTTSTHPESEDLHCDYIDTNYSIVASIICFMCFMFGVLYTFFGKLFICFGQIGIKLPNYRTCTLTQG